MAPDFVARLRELIEANRATALWSWPKDCFPETRDSAVRVLRAISARGNRATFIKAGQMLRELDKNSAAGTDSVSEGSMTSGGQPSRQPG